MRTTLTLEDDVAAIIRRLQRETDDPLKVIVNRALREGLKRIDQKAKPRTRFETASSTPHPASASPGPPFSPSSA